APALLRDCAFVGRWHDYNNGPIARRRGVNIVDISDPATPAIVGEVPATTNPGGVARELRTVDLPNFKMLVVMIFSGSLADRTNNKIHTYTFPSGDCTQPVHAGTFDMRTFRGHEFFLWVDPDPAHNVAGHARALIFITAPTGPPNIMVVDVSDPASPALIGLYDAGQPVVSPSEAAGTYLGNYAHSISLSDDGTEAYISYWDGGYFTMDTTAFTLGAPAGAFAPKGAMSAPFRYPLGEAGNTHSAVRIPGTDTVVVGDEIYISTDGCPFGWMRTVDIGDAATPPRQVGEFRLAENRSENCVDVPIGPPDATGTRPVMRAANVRNADGALIDGTFSMHNQTVLPGFALASWYGAGLRVIDVRDPRAPAEVGSFVPRPLDVTTSIPSTSAPTYGRTAGVEDDWWVATWSYPIVRDGLIYVTDVRNGLYILRPSSTAPFKPAVDDAGFSEGNSNLGAVRRRS
ncbi:MAG TPA: hypothetical protein VM600_09565, partial [Actinomycetota bacterium]|nr:hypothetical protein [Actinomycetota bacterium]